MCSRSRYSLNYTVDVQYTRINNTSKKAVDVTLVTYSTKISLKGLSETDYWTLLESGNRRTRCLEKRLTICETEYGTDLSGQFE